MTTVNTGGNRRTPYALLALLVAALIAVAGCGSSGSGTPRSPMRAVFHDPSPPDGGSGGGDEVPPSEPEPSPSPTPLAAASPSGTAPSVAPSAAAVAAGIPVFPPAPVPVPIAIAAGPSVPFLSRIPTDQPVAFLTIDDGWNKLPEAVSLMAAAHVPVTLFLTIDAIRPDPKYFKPLQASGAVIEAHTITHRSMVGMSYAAQKTEACGSADQLGQLYGRRPVLFRPPFGSKDATTLKVVHDCGMKAAFFWTETVDKGIVRYQSGTTIKRGDIILMHFRPAFTADFLAALRAIHDAGLTPALLEDYLPG